jgi:hypothetical protein
MSQTSRSGDGMVTLSEIKEFASFSSASQRYIRRSLDVAYDRSDAIAIWSRDSVEAYSIETQASHYVALGALRALVPDSSDLEQLHSFMGPLIGLSGFDLGQNRLDGFGAYRFLYERLLGANARPWLPSAFCAAASLPNLNPIKRRQLLQSISEAAATAPGWSQREPSFFPEWVEKIDA